MKGKKMNKLYAVNNILFLIFMLIAIPTIFMSEIGSNLRYRNANKNEEIISGSKASKLMNNNKRTSLITYNEIVIIDSSKMTFIVPISQSKLKKKQEVEIISADFYEKMPINKVNTLLNDIPDHILTLPKMLMSGIYNNMYLYSNNNNLNKVLFNKRVSISNVHMVKINSIDHLIIRFTDYDSNKDGSLSWDDTQKMAIFNLEGDKIIEITPEEYSFQDILFVENDNLYVQVEDINNSKLAYDKIFKILRIDLITGKQHLLIDNDFQNLIQDILDGKNIKDGAQSNKREG